MDYQKKYYKFKSKYLKLKNQLFGGDEPIVEPVIIKNYNNGIGYFQINYVDSKDIIINGKEIKKNNFNIKMTYTPDVEVKLSLDEGEKGAYTGEIELIIDLINKTTSNVKITGVFSDNAKNAIKESLKKLFEYSYKKQPKQHDVLSAQAVILKYKNAENINPILWLVDEL
jgi:hypothetical protein